MHCTDEPSLGRCCSRGNYPKVFNDDARLWNFAANGNLAHGYAFATQRKCNLRVTYWLIWTQHRMEVIAVAAEAGIAPISALPCELLCLYRREACKFCGSAIS